MALLLSRVCVLITVHRHVYSDSSLPVGIIPMEGILITAHVLCMSPNSLGVLTPASSKATDDPIIDPCYFTIEHDRVVIRAGMRRALQAMDSSVLRNFI